MLDCELMVKVVNHLRKTEQFQKLEETYIKQTTRKPLKEIAAGVSSALLGAGVFNLFGKVELSPTAESIAVGLISAFGTGALLIPMGISHTERCRAYYYEDKINNVIKDCYLQEQSVQEKMSRGVDEISAREQTKLEFQSMSDCAREIKNNRFEKDLKTYEIEYGVPFDYRTFIVEEENVEDDLNDMINCEILDTQAVDSEFEGENLEITEQTQETEPTM